MKSIKIFLASSAELLEDREAFEQYLSRRSKLWEEDRDMKLQLVNWEDFIDAISKTRLQNEYNKAIREADIFVMLFWTKVGKYTEEEFDTAYAAFQQKGNPLIYTYFKDADSPQPKQESLTKFSQRLSGELGHFKTVYKNTEGLLLHFGMQLDKLYRLKAPLEEVKNNTPGKAKADVLALIAKNELGEAFNHMSAYFGDKNIKFNTLLDEYVNPANNFNLAQYLMRLQIFVNQNWR